MTSYVAKDLGATAQLNGQARKPWVTPSVQIIPLKSAERGPQSHHPDGVGGKIVFRS